MPYKLSRKGSNLYDQPDYGVSATYDLTDLQRKALNYLYEYRNLDRYIHADEVARAYDYSNGQYFRGVLASLYARGLLDKLEDPIEEAYPHLQLLARQFGNAVAYKQIHSKEQ